MGRPRWGNAYASIISSQIITGPKFHTNYQDEAFYGEQGARLDPDPWCLKTQVEGGETLEKVRRRGLEPGEFPLKTVSTAWHQMGWKAIVDQHSVCTHIHLSI